MSKIIPLIFLACFFVCCDYPHKKTSPPNEFEYVGQIFDSTMVCDFSRDFNYTGFAPSSVINNGVVSNETIAVAIAKVYVSHIYGKECLLKEKPYIVKLINDSLWSISGSLPERRYFGGTFSLRIDKKTGGVVSIKHGK